MQFIGVNIGVTCSDTTVAELLELMARRSEGGLPTGDREPRPRAGDTGRSGRQGYLFCLDLAAAGT